MDGPERASQPSADVEVLLSEWRADLRLGSNRRGGAVHDERVTLGRLRRRDPALALFHAASKAPGAMEPDGHLALGSRHSCGDPRQRHRDLDVFPGEALSIRRQSDEHPLSRAETPAHDCGTDLRAWGCYMGLQRHAVHGSVSGAADRWTSRRRRAPRRRNGHSTGAAWTWPSAESFSPKTSARG